MRPRSIRSLLLAASALLLASPAAAISLADIQAAISSTGSFVGSVGDLTFTFTKIATTATPGFEIDLSEVELMLVSDDEGPGFDLVPEAGALRVWSGALADLKLEFTVESTLGILRVGNTLFSDAFEQAIATVSELIVEEPGVDIGVSTLLPSRLSVAFHLI